jgi:hypothetical protein
MVVTDFRKVQDILTKTSIVLNIHSEIKASELKLLDRII